MSELKMSDVFNLPVRAAQLEVYGANSNPEMTFDDIENAAAHAINSHDQLVDTITEQEEVIGELESLVLSAYLEGTVRSYNTDGSDCHWNDSKSRIKLDDIIAKHKQSKGE